MESLSLFIRLFPYVGLLCYGFYLILEVFYPRLRDQDFNHWEITDAGGTQVQILGWRKVLTPPRVIAEGYMSERSACLFATILGIVLILIGIFGIRHVSGFPHFISDVFNKF